jgi:DNA-binding transcriptional LysR family regulator
MQQINKLDILGIQAFVAIAQFRSFSRAAKSLFITQAALSRRLQNLENELEIALVERTTRQVQLTGVGLAFLGQSRRLLGELEASVREVKETGKAQRGDITIACVPTVGIRFLPDAIQAYAKSHPGNRIRILDHSSAGVANSVLSREAEFGIVIASERLQGLRSVPLMKDRYLLACRDDHPLARRPKVTWKLLEQFPMILPGQVNGNRSIVELELARVGVSLQSHFEVQRSSTAVGLVAKGVAAAIVPELAIEKGTYPRVKTIPVISPIIFRSLSLVSRQNAVLSPAAQAFYDLILSLVH